MRQCDIFDIFNRFFGNMDIVMRDMEREFENPNLFPKITIPSIKTYYSEQRALKENGVTTYYNNGKVSRLDGPAVIYDDDREDEYWLDGKRITKEEQEKALINYEEEKEHIIYVDGVPKRIKGKQYKEMKRLIEDSS